MDSGENQEIYKEISQGSSLNLAQRWKGVKKWFNPYRKEIAKGYALGGLSGALLINGAWSLDWAQFDVVDVPLIVPGHVKIADEAWFGFAMGCGAVAQYLAQKSGRILGKASGHKEAKADIQTESDLPDEESELGGKTLESLKPIGLTLAAAGLVSSGTTFVYDQFLGVHDFAGMSHGQLWNFSWVGVTGLGTMLYGLGSYIQGVREGTRTYLNEWREKRERYATGVASETSATSYGNAVVFPQPTAFTSHARQPNSPTISVQPDGISATAMYAHTINEKTSTES